MKTNATIRSFEQLERALQDSRPWDTADYLRAECFLGQTDYDEDPDEIGTEGLSVEDGFTNVMKMPTQPLFGEDERRLWRRVLLTEALGLPPQNRPEALIRSTRDALEASGHSVTPEVLFAGIQLGLATVMGVSIGTHPRDIARHIGVRYQRLLLVRRAALAQIERLGPWATLREGGA